MHDVCLRGLAFEETNGQPRIATEERPVFVERMDENFLSAILTELQTASGRSELAKQIKNAGEESASLELFQPVHRTFYVVTVEAVCKVFGDPRLDPRSIDSAGVVVRRILPSGKRQAWMRKDGQVLGWCSLADINIDVNADPDPARRPAPYAAGHPVINERLRQTLGAPGAYEESVSRLFVAPPNVCTSIGRTLLYGLLPLSGADPLPPAAPVVHYDADDIEQLLKPWLVHGASPPSLSGLAGKQFSSKQWRDDAASLGSNAASTLDGFVNLLWTLMSVFDAFEDAAMVAALNKVMLEYPTAGKQNQTTKLPAGEKLAQALDTFVHAKSGATFTFPLRWPALSKTEAQVIAQAASITSSNRLAGVIPRAGRYGEPGMKYEVRAFIRVKRDDGCPPRIVWTQLPSCPFSLVPWYEAGKLPPVEVVLPPVTREYLKKITPNVAFRVPGDVFNLLAKNGADNFLGNKLKSASESGMEWICAFNIPIITLCAFIVLSIFLMLLNIVFNWIALVMIWIPLPKANKGGAP